MESNWRFNVWELGMTTMEAKLIARLREPFGFFTHIGSFTFDNPIVYHYIFDGALVFQNPDMPWLFNPNGTISTAPFPGTFDVFPDR